MKQGDGKVNVYQGKEASGRMVNDFPTIDEKNETHQMMREIEPPLIASGCRTWRNILLTHKEYTCHFLKQTFCYPKRANLVLVWGAGS